MKKFKKFLDPIYSMQKWLNDLGEKNYKLSSLRGSFFEFEETESKYEYKVYYFKGPEKDVKSFLAYARKNDIEIFQYPISASQISLFSFMAATFDSNSKDISYKASLFATHIYVLAKPKVGESIEEVLGEDDNEYYYRRQMENKLILAIILFIPLLLSYFRVFGGTFEQNKLFVQILVAIELLILIFILFLNFEKNKFLKSKNIKWNNK